MTDCARTVERERDLSCWLDILPLYAGLQIDLADHADELVAVGVPDMRLSTLPSSFEKMLDDLGELPAYDLRRLEGNVSRVAEMCDELAGYGLPETIQHDDFHDGQVFVRDGRYQLLDWGDACVSHPFFTLSVTLEGTLAWGLDDIQGSVDVTPFRDAYLEPFTPLANGADLDAACTTALRLGWVCRAVNCHLERVGSHPDARAPAHVPRRPTMTPGPRDIRVARVDRRRRRPRTTAAESRA